MTAPLRDTVVRAVAGFAAAARRKGVPRPAAGLILGSGLHGLAARIGDRVEIDPTTIAGFPRPTVPALASRCDLPAGS